jgi:hypothetical protein
MILKVLESGQTLNPMQALRVLGVFRLAARIEELRKQGHLITTVIKKTSDGKEYAEYSLIQRKTSDGI